MKFAFALTATLATLSCASPPPPVAPASIPAKSQLPVDAHAPSKPPDGMFKPSPDTAADDSSLSAGTVVVQVADADNAPLPRVNVIFEKVILREHSSAPDVLSKSAAPTAESGSVVFHTTLDARARYIVKSQRGDGTFSIKPFELGATGKRVQLHTYETVTAIERAKIVSESITYLGVRADAIEIEQVHRFYNFDRTAWVPTNVRVAFAPGVYDFSASDLGLPVRTTDITNDGFSIVGTLSPGQDDLRYQYKVPRDPSGTQTLTLHMPPHNARARVILEAAGNPTLKVAGFPEPRTDVANGASVLVTETQITPGSAVQDVEITLSGAPH